MPGLLGKKIGMTSVFSAEGKNDRTVKYLQRYV